MNSFNFQKFIALLICHSKETLTFKKYSIFRFKSNQTHEFNIHVQKPIIRKADQSIESYYQELTQNLRKCGAHVPVPKL